MEHFGKDDDSNVLGIIPFPPLAPNSDVECNKYMFYFSLNSSVHVFIFKEKLKNENLYF
jgi:hypothetical protein